MLKDGMHYLLWKGYRVVGHYSCWRTICFGKDIVQLLSRIWQRFGCHCRVSMVVIE